MVDGILIFQLSSVSNDKSNAEDKLKATETKLELLSQKVNEISAKYEMTSGELQELAQKSALQIKSGT